MKILCKFCVCLDSSVQHEGKIREILVENNGNPSVVEYWLTAVWCWGAGKKVSLGFRSRKKLGRELCKRMVEQRSSGENGINV